MIAAVALSMGGVWAAACAPADPVDPVQKDNALVYCVKFSVKTTKGICGVVTTVTPGQASPCVPGTPTVDQTTTVVRAADSTKFEGWIYDCSATCDLISTGSAVVWDSKRKAQLKDAAFTTTFINVIGTKQADAEWAWTFAGQAAYADSRTQDYALTGAGLGKYSKKAGYYTSFSGNFAGTAGASYDLSKKATNSGATSCCDPSQVWQCADLATLADSDTVAYGTWSVKYNSSASKKYLKNGYLKVPSYVEL